MLSKLGSDDVGNRDGRMRDEQEGGGGGIGYYCIVYVCMCVYIYYIKYDKCYAA